LASFLGFEPRLAAVAAFMDDETSDICTIEIQVTPSFSHIYGVHSSQP
jgi:hypothetical protein